MSLHQTLDRIAWILRAEPPCEDVCKGIADQLDELVKRPNRPKDVKPTSDGDYHGWIDHFSGLARRTGNDS